MVAPKPLLPEMTQEVLRDLIAYDPETGIMSWLSRLDVMFEGDERISARRAATWNKRFAGMACFTTVDNQGYFTGSILRLKFKAHRIIWMWMTGTMPDEIDHINGNPGDNRWANLRAVEHIENQRNRRIRRDNKSGTSGVQFIDNRWTASIGVKGKIIYLGRFDDKEAAIQARKAAELKYGFHPNHGRAA